MTDSSSEKPRAVWIGPVDSPQIGLADGLDCLRLDDCRDLVAQAREFKADVIVIDVSQAGGDDLHRILEARQPTLDASQIAILSPETKNLDAAIRSGIADFIIPPISAREFDSRITLATEKLKSARIYRQASGYMVTNHLTIVLPSALALVAPVSDMLTRDLQPRGQCTEEEALQIRLTLSEVLTNAVEHGSWGIDMEDKISALESGVYEQLVAQRKADPDRQGKRVFISMDLTPTQVTYIVKDEGSGFDYGQVLEKLADPEPTLPSGRGLFFIKHFMDEFSYGCGGREVTLVKKLKPPTV